MCDGEVRLIITTMLTCMLHVSNMHSFTRFQRFPNGFIALQNSTFLAMNILFTFCSRVSIVSVVPSIFSGALSFIMYMVVPSSGDIFFPVFSGVGWPGRLTMWYIETINCILLYS